MYIYGICYRIRLENQIVRILKQTQELMNYKQLKIHSFYTLNWYINFCLRFGEYAYEKNCNNFFSSNSTRIYLTTDEIRMLRYSYSWNIYQTNENTVYTYFFLQTILHVPRERKKNDKSIRQNLSKNDSCKRIVSDRCILCALSRSFFPFWKRNWNVLFPI